MRSKIKRSLIISKSLPPCEAAEIRIFLPCIISEALPSAVKAGALLTWQHLAAVFMCPSAAFHTCAPILWAHRQLFPFDGTFVKHFPPVKVQTCLLSEIRGCHGDTARSTCSNDAFLLFLFLRSTGRRSDCFLPPTPPPSVYMLWRCGFTDCFLFFFFPHRDLIKKFLVIDRARRLGNMKVSGFLCLTQMAASHISSLWLVVCYQRGWGSSWFQSVHCRNIWTVLLDFFHNRPDSQVHAGAFIWFASK